METRTNGTWINSEEKVESIFCEDSNTSTFIFLTEENKELNKKIELQNKKLEDSYLRKRRRQDIRNNKMIAERITKKCVFEGIEGKVSPIKMLIPHEI